MSQARIEELDEDSFDDRVAESARPIIVDFWATWCTPCKTIAPVLDELAEEFGERVTFARVDVDANGDLSNRFGIRNVPTVLIFRGGCVVDQVVGAAPKATIRALIERQLG